VQWEQLAGKNLDDGYARALDDAKAAALAAHKFSRMDDAWYFDEEQFLAAIAALKAGQHG